MSIPDPADKTMSGSGEKPDPDEFIEFFTTYNQRLILHLRSLGADAADASDLASETFSRAARQWGTIRDHSWPWLAAVASNTYLLHYESDSQHNEVPIPPEHDGGPAANVHSREPLYQSRYLSPQQQEIAGFKADGLSTAEIAERLSVANSTVRSQLYRIRQKPEISHREIWSSSSFIGQLPDVERTRLLEAGTPLRFEDDQILLVQGDAGDFLYVLTSGLVKLIVGAASSAQTTLAIRSRGDLVGEFSVLDNKPRTSTARAAGPVTALKVNGAAFLAIVGRSHEAQNTVTKYLLAKMRESTERRAAERIWDARERLAQVLYELAQKHAQPDADGMIRIPLTQSELGELSGVAVSTAERVLKELRRHGAVSTRYREITIMDMAYLDSIRFPRQNPESPW